MIDFYLLFNYDRTIMDNIISIAFTLFLVIDALGTLPAYLSQVEGINTKKSLKIAIRELLFALILMFAFFYIGQLLLELLGFSRSTVELSGGILLFLIAIRLIFGNEEHSTRWKKGRPFIVPIATPLLAGPSFFAVITIFAESDIANYIIFSAVLIAWFASALIYLFGRPIYNLIGDKGLLACQRLMGLLIALVSVRMILEGIKELVRNGL